MSSRIPVFPSVTDTHRLVDHDRADSHDGPLHWRRPAGRYNHPQRYYRQHNFRRFPKPSERKYKALYPASHLPYWDYLNGGRRGFPRYPSSAGSGDQGNSASCEPYPPHEGLLVQPTTIPQMITPNTREKAFSEIVNGTFDFEKSPFSLGKTLASSATISDESRLLNGLPNPFGLDTTSSKSGSSSSMVDQSKKQAAPSENLQQGNSVNNARIMSTAGQYAAIEKPYNLLQDQSQTDSYTVGFGSAPNTNSTETEEFHQLLQMIELHTQQSQDLADLVSTYLSRGGSYGDIRSVAGVIHKFYNKPPRRLNQNPEGILQVASLPGGGDSPDPPRDHRIPFRGHMIDRVDTGQPAVNKGENKNGDESTTTACENLGQHWGSALYGDSEGPNGINTQGNSATTNRGTTNSAYFTMPVYGLPEDPALSTAEFGGLYPNSLPTETSNKAASKKRSRQDADDRYQNKTECSVDCCHHHIDESKSSAKNQCHSQCQGERSKRPKLNNLTGPPTRPSCPSCKGPQSLVSSQSSQSGYSHSTRPLFGASKSAHVSAASANPGHPSFYKKGQKLSSVAPKYTHHTCGCRPRCLCRPVCRCGQDTSVLKNGDNTANSVQPQLRSFYEKDQKLSSVAPKYTHHTCSCRPRCLCRPVCRCGQDASVLMDGDHAANSPQP
ncbi:hypothetical protein GX48_05948 [Paracoccidioides brasiliensis]|nr:hypothetical protein GX48_05948 [Paracoccidioides brasiliensis]